MGPYFYGIPFGDLPPPPVSTASASHLSIEVFLLALMIFTLDINGCVDKSNELETPKIKRTWLPNRPQDRISRPEQGLVRGCGKIALPPSITPIPMKCFFLAITDIVKGDLVNEKHRNDR